ncbi:conserved hypothetical protein [Culex quinquefasciatus]|uniref:Uncharacterized protein n=1 Tax=Culex quinquefasciatus TaxID=7176 RepID=B0WZ27_CULQU|nr:conserved hypothetical protein [Culex quinquefasciatus]|eukprot:XP_001862649.1 conserved hypothetical protein [Culex quinquefasciatus]
MMVLIECTPLSSIDTFPSKLSKLEENNNKSTYLKRAGEPTQLPNPNGGGNPPPGSRFISSLPPVAAASSGLLSSSSSSSNSQSAPVAPQPTINSLIPDSGQDVDDTFAGGSLAGTDFGPDVVRYTRKEADPVGSTASSVEVTAATTTGAGRLKKNGTIFTRNEQNITTLKLKNYNRGGAGVEKEEMKAAASTVRVPDRGTRLVDTLMQVATVENGTSVEQQDVEVQPEQVTEVAVDLNVTESALDESSSSAVDNTTVPAAPTGSIQSIDFNSSSSSSSTSFSNSSSDSDLASSSSNGRELPDDSHSDSSGGSNSRIGKILSSDFRDFVSPAGGQPNASSYIAQSIAFSTQNLQEGVDDQDHPLEDDDYRRSSRSQSPGRLNVGAISGICLASLGLLSGLSAALVILYRRYLYLNKPQALSEPDSSGYIDDSTIRDNSDEMYSLDNDSFLNSLEAMTIQNYWTDNVKHTKL